MVKVLLAIDDSDFSEAALQTVCGQLRPSETEIHVLSVIDPLLYLPVYNALPNVGSIDSMRDEYQKQALQLVDRAAATLREAGYRVTEAVEEAEPRTAIVDYAQRVNADLIVVGSHGRRGFPRLLLGSVSEYVARHAHCSVEIVRRQPAAA
jgi:nucleotide-binding universal stress UspA family protein